MSGTIDTGLNFVPEDWEVTSFGDCAEILAGQSPKGNTYNTEGDGTPLLNGPAEFGAWTPISKKWTSRPTKFAQKDDVLFCVRGNTTGRMNISDREYCIGRGLAAIRQINGKSNTPFVYFLLCFLRPTILAIATAGGSTFPNISKSTLSEFEVALPPLPEQKKIAHVLSTVQKAIQAQEKIIQTTTELKKALMHKFFTEGLRNEPQKQTEIGPMPESWEVVKIKDTGTAVTGSTPSTKNPEFYGNGYNLISPADLDKGKYVWSAHKTLTEAGFMKCRSIPRDSVLVGCIGNVGKLGMVADDRSATNQQINTIVANREFNPHFLFYVLQFCRSRLKQVAAKVTVPILNKSNFEKFQIAAPPRTDQDKIAVHLSVLDQKLENAEVKVDKLQDLFRTLLHELMTAKLRVNRLNLGMENSD